MSSQNKKLLIIDDEEEIVDFLNIILGDDFDVTYTTVSEDAIHLIENNDFDLIMTDIRMPNLSGDHLAELVRLTGFETPIIFMSGHMDSHQLEKEYDSCLFLSKPLPPVGELMQILDNFISQCEKSKAA